MACYVLRPEEDKPDDRQHEDRGDGADGQQRQDGRPRLRLPCFSGRFDNPAMAFCVFDFCHCVLIPSTARTFRATYEGQRPMADDVPDRKAAISAAAVRSDLLSSTTLEHAETITRQRYGVKDYFPRESSIMKSWINAPCAAGAISPLAAKFHAAAMASA